MRKLTFIVVFWFGNLKRLLTKVVLKISEPESTSLFFKKMTGFTFKHVKYIDCFLCFPYLMKNRSKSFISTLIVSCFTELKRSSDIFQQLFKWLTSKIVNVPSISVGKRVTNEPSLLTVFLVC